MKKYFSISVALLLFLSGLKAQENSNLAFVSSKSAVIEGKSSGIFKFTLPTSAVKEDVDKSASYYVHNFTVNFDNASKVAEIKMVSNDETSRKIIVRFLSACGIQSVNIEGNIIDIYPFYETYLK